MGPPFPTAGILVILPELCAKLNASFQYLPEIKFAFKKYHIVFTPKYRRKIIYNQLRADIRDIIKDLCKWKGVEIIEGHMMPDHIHLLVSVPPKYSISQFMGYLKGKSAMMIFERHANLKYKFGNRNFWATGYYVSTVGLNTATVQKYIREQEKQDQIEDSLSRKEYKSPFKGSK